MATDYAGNIIGFSGEGKYPAADGQRKFREVQNEQQYDKYVMKTAQAAGVIAIVYIPKGLTIIATDTVTLTVAAPA